MAAAEAERRDAEGQAQAQVQARADPPVSPATSSTSSGSGKGRADTGAGAAASGAPAEFLCAINGHVMQQPVRSPHGQVYEAATIELWLSQQGSVCPLTGRHLQRSDLVADVDLRAEISRWLIRRTMEANSRGREDDEEDDDLLYDF